MNISRRNRMILDILIIAELALEEMSEEEIQEQYGSDYYRDLKEFVKYNAFHEFKNESEGV